MGKRAIVAEQDEPGVGSRQKARQKGKDEEDQEHVLPPARASRQEVSERVADEETQQGAAEGHQQRVEEDPKKDRCAGELAIVLEAESELDAPVVGRGQEAENQDETEGHDKEGQVPDSCRCEEDRRSKATGPPAVDR